MQKCPPALLSISLTTLVISSTGIAVEADPSSHVHNVTLFLGNSEAPQLTEAGTKLALLDAVFLKLQHVATLGCHRIMLVQEQ